MHLHIESTEIFLWHGVESIFIDENLCRMSDFLRWFNHDLFLHGAFWGQQLGIKLCGAEKKTVFAFRFFYTLFLEEVQYWHFISKLSAYLSRSQIFVKFIGVWGLLHQCGTTGAQRTGKFFLNLDLKKNVIKTVDSIYLACNALSVIRLSLSSDENKTIFVSKVLV